MSYKKNKSYIPNEELNRGIQLCDQNAKSLLEDAQLLFSKGSHGHSLGLAILSMEEYAKKLVLATRRIYPNEFEKEVRDAFRDHDLKLQLAALIYILMREYPDTLLKNEIQEIVVGIGNNLGFLRERGFYVDFGKDRWLCPQDEELKRMTELQIQRMVEFFKKVDSLLTRIMEKE